MLRWTDRFDAFDLNFHPLYQDPPDVWPVPKHLFWDSDVAKWIEGMAYIWTDSKMDGDEGRAAVADLVFKIRKAPTARWLPKYPLHKCRANTSISWSL